MIDLEKLTTRQLQKEAARALTCMEATNDNIYQFNKVAHHNSNLWYSAIIIGQLMYRYQDIKMVHYEITQRCQAACPMCDRNINGGKDSPHVTNAELSLGDAQRIFEPDFIRQLKTFYMCGNLGDPIMAKDTLETFKWIRSINPNVWLSMNTNAGAQDDYWWYELAQTFGRMGTVIFSVDGLSDTNHLYRQNVRWEKVERAMDAFIDSGGRARWDYLIFEHNEHQVEEARRLSEQKGFERFQTKKSARFVTTKLDKKEEHQAKNRKDVETQKLKKPSEKNQNTATKKIDSLIEKHGSMDNYLDKCKINCKVAKEGNIYISAEGLLMPCCWTASRMYKWWHKDPTVEPVWNHINAVGGKDSVNAKIHGLKKVFHSGLLESITNSWSAPSIKEGRLKVCAEKCGAEYDPFKSQFI